MFRSGGPSGIPEVTRDVGDGLTLRSESGPRFLRRNWRLPGLSADARGGTLSAPRGVMKIPATVHVARPVQAAAGLSAVVGFLCLPGEAHASFLSPELEDKLATFIAVFVLFVVPAVLIALFWMVHVLPEKIAHKRQHPQFEAIRTLCLLSLVFGGLLWPLAWIWAYSKPVMYKMAYGTDKAPHDEPYPGETASLHDRVARLENTVPAEDLEVLRADLAVLEAKAVKQGGR